MSGEKKTMTDEQKKKRNEFADALERVAELAKDVPSGGWDIPASHIKSECEKWAKSYRVNLSTGGVSQATGEITKRGSRSGAQRGRS